MPRYFIPRVLKSASVEMYVRNGYDGDSETVNMLARHTVLKCWIIITSSSSSSSSKKVFSCVFDSCVAAAAAEIMWWSGDV